jgi:carboxylesterase type B
MQWAQRNIAAFGGDPARVFLDGQSAGAGAISAHMVAPRSWGLFARAGMQSTAMAGWIVQTMAEAQDTFGRLLQALGCPAAAPPAAAYRCLAAAPAQRVQDAAAAACRNGFGATVDGAELAAAPWVLAAAGRLAPGVQVLAGSAREDADCALPAQADRADFAAFATAEFAAAGNLTRNASLMRAVMDLYGTAPMEPGPDPAYSEW